MARTLGIAAVLAALAATLGYSASAGSDERILVTRESSSLPSGCTPREVARLLIRLADAVNTGDANALDRLFAIEDPPGRHGSDRPEPFFRWYSVGATALYDRSELFPYFAERRRHGEHWEIIAVDVAPSWVRGGAGIGYALRRRADDIPAASWLTRGKGEIDCAAQRIYVWAMGESPAQGAITPCPLPAGWTPGAALVACSRAETDDRPGNVTARAFAPDFRIHAGSGRLPRQCSPAFTAGKLRSALTAFNGGRGTVFARHFVAQRPSFHPYTASQPQLLGRARIARFVTRRHARGDGWTGTALHAPQQTDRKTGIYLLDFLISSPGKPLTPASAKAVIDCRSGLFSTWVGPAVASP